MRKDMGMKTKTTFLFAALALAGVAQAFTVTDVTAHQRWPWNGHVDVDFNIGEATVGETFKIELKATYAGGDRTLEARTYVSEPMAKAGANRVTWDFGADNPGFKAEDLRVAVTATPFTNGMDGVWMVIDLSGGKDATKYPVRYTTIAPVHSVNANDVCKTTELWLKRIKGGSYMFCHGYASSGYFRVNLKKDFYMGVFECTQQQWAQVTGAWPSAFSNTTWRATRPVEKLSLSGVFGHYMWPENQEPSSGSFIRKMRDRTGLATFNLPTEAQWEWANRCGEVGGFNPCYSRPQIRYGLSETGVDFNCTPAENGTACVGTYVPNLWGLYETFGNVWELCLDTGVSETDLQKYYGTTFCGLTEEECTYDRVEVDDPIGGPLTGTYKPQYQYYHVLRGAGWYNTEGNLTHFQRRPNPDAISSHAKGVRFVVTCE